MKYDRLKEKKLLTLEEISFIYPFSKRTIQRYLKDKNFPYYKIAGKLYFKIEDIDEWIKEFKVN